MKIFKALLIFALISIISSGKSCDYGVPGRNSDECENYEVPPEAKYCCYAHISYSMDGRRFDIGACTPIRENEFNNLDLCIEEGKKALEQQGYIVYDFQIDCGQLASNYVQFSLIILILLFLN